MSSTGLGTLLGHAFPRNGTSFAGWDDSSKTSVPSRKFDEVLFRCEAPASFYRDLRGNGSLLLRNDPQYSNMSF